MEQFYYDAHRPGYRYTDRSASEQARAEMIRMTCDAWRNPVSSPVADVSIRPMPPIWAQQEGTSCEVDGCAGTWKKGEDGFLYCVPHDRTELPLGNDARPRYMSASEAQVIRDRAYQEYVDHVSNAWKQQ